MEKYSLSFLLGNLLLHQLSQIDDMTSKWLITMGVSAVIVSFVSTYFSTYLKHRLLQIGLLLTFFCSGFGLTWFHAQHKLTIYLPPQLQGKEIIVTGQIDSIPIQKNRMTRFNLKIIAIENHSKVPIVGGKIRLSGFEGVIPREKLRVGDVWRLKVKLKPPSGFMNPGGMDYEKWLFQQDIRATGYIRNGIENQLLEDPSSNDYGIDRFRQSLAEQLDRHLKDNSYLGLYKAIILGIKTDIPAEQWEVFIHSGTNHLIAISGLHIGLIAAIGFFLGRYLWSSSSRWLERVPAQQIGALTAILFALFYAALAGFAIPTQRALIMLSIALSGVILKVYVPARQIISIALILVLCFDPMSSLANGFWLSFMAVASILFYLQKSKSNIEVHSEELSWLQRTKKIVLRFTLLPIVVFLGLLPITLLFFSQFSILSPIANMLAVPWMSLIIIPLSLLASVFLGWAPELALWLFSGISILMEPLWWWLNKIVAQDINLYYLSQTEVFALISILLASILLVQRNWGKKRFMLIILVLPISGSYYSDINPGHFKLTILDVGQGLALMVRTDNHVLMYDTGNAFGQRFNMADQVIIPYFRHEGIERINRLVLSHADNDHIGSAKYLLKTYRPDHILSGEVKRLKQKQNIVADRCISGQQWSWDGVEFKVLSPSLERLQKLPSNSNNLSCVILVRAANGYSALLTGDVEKEVEQELLQYSDINGVDLLVVGHHGSKTSSSKEFVEWVAPRDAVFTFGYRNRYGFPAATVVANLKQQNTRLYATVNGTIDISSDLSNNAAQIKEYRKENGRYWNRPYQSF